MNAVSPQRGSIPRSQRWKALALEIASPFESPSVVRQKSWIITPCINLVPRACDPREVTWGSGIIRCRKPGILAKIELCIPFQRPIRFLPETDYPRASRSFPRIAGSGNEIDPALPGFTNPRTGNATRVVYVSFQVILLPTLLPWLNEVLHVISQPRSGQFHLLRSMFILNGHYMWYEWYENFKFMLAEVKN
jgi:hypothetical protein